MPQPNRNLSRSERLDYYRKIISLTLCISRIKDKSHEIISVDIKEHLTSLPDTETYAQLFIKLFFEVETTPNVYQMMN